MSEGRWKLAKHLIALDDVLVRMMTGELKNVIVDMPPRHGKSELVSKYFPAYAIGRLPKKRIMLASYEADFAKTWGRKVRDLLKEHGEKSFGVRVRPDTMAADNWEVIAPDGICYHGGMISTGVGGALTGRGADWLIIDDPIKNRDQAMSKTYRDKVDDWYRSTAFTRLEPGGCQLIVVTRWHEDDLVGRILEREGNKWTKIIFPAINEENNTLGLPPGEALWPERYDLKALANIRESIGEFWWQSLYMQSPTSPEGNLFKKFWFRYFTHNDLFRQYILHSPDGNVKVIPCDSCWMVTTVDIAASEKNWADYTVIQTWAITPDYDCLLIEEVRDKMQAAAIPGAIMQCYHRRHPTLVVIAKQWIGISTVQACTQMGLPVVAFDESFGDKMARSMAASARAEAGKVYLPSGTHWVDDWMMEILQFPNGKHDDRVDCFSMMGHQILKMLGFVGETDLHIFG